MNRQVIQRLFLDVTCLTTLRRVPGYNPPHHFAPFSQRFFLAFLLSYRGSYFFQIFYLNKTIPCCIFWWQWWRAWNFFSKGWAHFLILANITRKGEREKWDNGRNDVMSNREREITQPSAEDRRAIRLIIGIGCELLRVRSKAYPFPSWAEFPRKVWFAFDKQCNI